MIVSSFLLLLLALGQSGAVSVEPQASAGEAERDNSSISCPALVGTWKAFVERRTALEDQRTRGQSQSWSASTHMNWILNVHVDSASNCKAKFKVSQGETRNEVTRGEMYSFQEEVQRYEGSLAGFGGNTADLIEFKLVRKSLRFVSSTVLGSRSKESHSVVDLPDTKLTLTSDETLEITYFKDLNSNVVVFKKK